MVLNIFILCAFCNELKQNSALFLLIFVVIHAETLDTLYMKKSEVIKYLTFAVALVEFYSEFTHHRELMFFTKPLLLPMIILYYFVSMGSWNKTHKLILTALFLSWIGDVSLMLTPENESDLSIMGVQKSKYFFLLGLSAFLINHLFLITAYRIPVISERQTLFHKNKLLFLPLIIFCILMVAIIAPAVYNNPEKNIATIPVIIYAIILTSMAAFALNRFGFVNKKSFWFVFIGALFFVFSDSIIALNFLVFPELIPKPGFIIITTYFVAEFLIAEGMLKK